MNAEDKYFKIKEIALRIDSKNNELTKAIIEINNKNNDLLLEINTQKALTNRLYNERRILEDIITELDLEIESLRRSNESYYIE